MGHRGRHQRRGLHSAHPDDGWGDRRGRRLQWRLRRKRMVDVVAGFGLLQDLIVDQHFSQRGRLGRLLAVFAGTPGLIGIGLDEDTAVLIDREGKLETLGSNMVTIVDGRNTVSDYFERDDGEVLTITGSSLHVLAGRRQFDLNARQAIGSNGHRPKRTRTGSTAAKASHVIQILRTKTYRGPNIWARVPVIHLALDIGELEARPTNTIPNFCEGLTDLIPSLYDHECSLGHPGGFLERVRDGTTAGHVVEHVALELQNLAGAEISRGKTRDTGDSGVYDIVYTYTQEEVGLAAGKLAVRLINHLVYGNEPDFDFVGELEQGDIRLAEQLAYGPSTAAIVSAAERAGIPVLRLHPRRSIVQLGHGCHQQKRQSTRGQAEW